MSDNGQESEKAELAKTEARLRSGDWIDVRDFSSRDRSKQFESIDPSALKYAKAVTAAAVDTKPEAPKPEPPTIIPRRVLSPEYAIGQKLITRDEYNSIKSTYLAESQICFGLILPIVFLTIAVAWRGFLNQPLWVIVLGALATIAVAIWAGLDRLHKYYSELQSLIVSRYLQGEDARKNQARPPKAAIDAIDSLSRDIEIQVAALKLQILPEDDEKSKGASETGEIQAALKQMLSVFERMLTAVSNIKNALSGTPNPPSKGAVGSSSVKLPSSGDSK